MRQKFFGAILSAIAIVAAAPALAQPGKAPRQVQLIAMGVDGAPSPRPLSAENPTLVAPPPALETFRVHDLTRRYVEFRMSQELAAVGSATTSGLTTGDPTPRVAPFSSIIVPSWMKGYPLPAPGISPSANCAATPYRPSGILRRDAEARRALYFDMMSAIACEHGIPTGLFDAMIMRESSYNPVATSPKNAFGFAQLMPGTALELGVDRYDPAQNLRGGARYLRQQLDRFGQVHLALAAYNAGPGRVRNGAVPRIIETQEYVRNILTNWSRLSLPIEAVREGQGPSRSIRRQTSVATF